MTAFGQKAANRCRFLALAVFTFGFFMFAPVFSAHAQTPAVENVQTVATQAGIAGGTDLITIIGRIINILLGLLGIILLSLLIYAGYLYMTSGGDPEKVAKAKNYIRNAIIGLIIIASSFAIANFVLSQLAGITSETGGTSVGGAGGGGLFPSRAGSLGGGIIEYHSPGPNATNVPRNTAIVITFKEPILVSSMIKDWTEATSNTNIGLNTNTVKLYRTSQGIGAALATADVRVRVTADHKTFVMRPVAYLGSPSENQGYTVDLTPSLQREDARPAFSGSFSSGYAWQFEVSTQIDLTPPKITSVIPSPGAYAPNVVIQINFNEAVDPTSASGIYRPLLGSNFPNLQVSATPNATPTAIPTRPQGEFRISNQYRTVEFITDTPCEPRVNSCGQTIFCLPVNSSIQTLVRSAHLENPTNPQAVLTASGYDGVVDLAGNSFDGTGDGTAQGPDIDNYNFPRFGTTDRPNFTPPFVRSTAPQAGDLLASSNIPPDQRPAATFGPNDQSAGILRASTVNTDSVLITRQNESAGTDDSFWWTPSLETLSADETAPSTANPPALSRISIAHRVYQHSASSMATPPLYSPFLLSAIQNIYQNCFVPGAAHDPHDPDNAANPLNCLADPTNPNCCNNRPGAAACPYRSSAP